MKNLSFILLFVWAMLPTQMIIGQFANGDFESSSSCSPTDCNESDISCIEGWWGYIPNSPSDPDAWYSYACQSNISCGDLRGIRIQGREAGEFLAATRNPYFLDDPVSTVVLQFDLLPIQSDGPDQWRVSVWGSDVATDANLTNLHFLGSQDYNGAALVCVPMEVLLEEGVNANDKLATTFEYLVFGLDFIPPVPPLPPGNELRSLSGVIDNLEGCLAFSLDIVESGCDDTVCVQLSYDSQCLSVGCPDEIGFGCLVALTLLDGQLNVLSTASWNVILSNFNYELCFDSSNPNIAQIAVQLIYTLDGQTIDETYLLPYTYGGCGQYVVSSNESWSLDEHPDFSNYQEIRVQSGNSLTIESDMTVEFCEGGKLVIEQGAELELHGTLTSVICDSICWQGVIVDGDGTSSQDYINGYTQGYFQGKPGSVIENAIVGIDLRGENGTGGIVKCEETNFRNNQIGVKFSPFTNTAYFGGQPKAYNASFRNCDFKTDMSYQECAPFVAFAWMWGVDGIPFTGCHFTREHNVVNADEVTDFGYGILSIRSGFNLVSSPERDSYVNGLGYGVRVAQYSAIKPYYVRKAIFEDCYVGLAGSFSSFGTVVENTFLMGTAPDNFQTKQSGIILTGNQTGFEVQENTFISNKTNATATFGIISDDLGDMNNVIRKNYFMGDLFAGNQAIRRNGVQNFELSRGLSYECNENYLTEASNQYGFDFFIGEYPSTTIRKSQNAFSDQGKFISTGNLFSRNNPSKGDFNATFELNFDLIDYFYFDDQPIPDLQKPKQYSGIDKRIVGTRNFCLSTYCMPPCLITVDLPLRKADFASHRTLLNTAIANNDKVASIYHKSETDGIAGLIAQYYLYDTLSYSNDSLKQWYRNMEAITGQLLVSGQLLAEGDFSQAMSTINSISTSYAMSQRQIDGLNDLKTLYSVLNASKADSLTTGQRATVLAIAIDDGSLASPPAKAVLMLNGYHFDPVYYLDVKQSRIVEPSQQDPLSNENRLHVAVYPNPATEELYISMEQEMIGDQQYVFELIDMQGKLVVQEPLNNARLNVDLKSKSLVSGIYVYRIMDDEKVLDSGRVVIK